MKKYVISFVVFLAIFIASGALLDAGGHNALAWTLIITSSLAVMMSGVAGAIAAFVSVVREDEAGPDCPECGLPGKKQVRPTWTTCISCGKPRP